MIAIPRPTRSIVALGAALLLAAAASGKVTEKFSQTYPFNADGVISLSNVTGDIEIVAWDRNEVSLEAEKIARDERGLARMKIVIDASPSRLVIKTEHEKKFKFWHRSRAEVRYMLRVPAGVTLRKIDVVNSEVQVTGVRGHVDIDSVNGSIQASGLTAGGRFDTVNGSIRATFAAVGSSDRIILDTINGSCTVTLPANAAFTLDADSVNGRISCDFPITIGKSGRRHLKGSVNGGGATLLLDSINGSLNVRAAK